MIVILSVAAVIAGATLSFVQLTRRGTAARLAVAIQLAVIVGLLIQGSDFAKPLAWFIAGTLGGALGAYRQRQMAAS